MILERSTELDHLPRCQSSISSSLQPRTHELCLQPSLLGPKECLS